MSKIMSKIITTPWPISAWLLILAAGNVVLGEIYDSQHGANVVALVTCLVSAICRSIELLVNAIREADTENKYFLSEIYDEIATIRQNQ